MISAKKILKNIESQPQEVTKENSFKIRSSWNFKPTEKMELIAYIKDLKKDYPLAFSRKKKKQVLKGVNLQIYKNDRICLIGLNGAGKSTLIEILAGVQEKTNGEIYYAFDYLYEPYEKISIQFQKSRFPSGLTVKDVFNFIIKVRRNVVIDPVEKAEMMDTFAIKKLWNSEVNSLSGGQKQRVSIFCALIVKPKIVFLDELTTGLDVIYQKQILNYILQYVKKHEITLITVSHNLLEVESLATRIILLKDGKITADVDANKVVSNYELSSFVKELVR